jgi:hypothetical protein
MSTHTPQDLSTYVSCRRGDECMHAEFMPRMPPAGRAYIQRSRENGGDATPRARACAHTHTASSYLCLSFFLLRRKGSDTLVPFPFLRRKGSDTLRHVRARRHYSLCGIIIRLSAYWGLVSPQAPPRSGADCALNMGTCTSWGSNPRPHACWQPCSSRVRGRGVKP